MDTESSNSQKAEVLRMAEEEYNQEKARMVLEREGLVSPQKIEVKPSTTKEDMLLHYLKQAEESLQFADAQIQLMRQAFELIWCQSDNQRIIWDGLKDETTFNFTVKLETDDLKAIVSAFKCPSKDLFDVYQAQKDVLKQCKFIEESAFLPSGCIGELVDRMRKYKELEINIIHEMMREAAKSGENVSN
jgi:hypothetical protein